MRRSYASRKFHLSLPLARKGPANASGERADRRGWVADADLLDFNLKRAGFGTLVAHDALMACRLAGTKRPDLILLDVLLPELEGWEMYRVIRTHRDPEVSSTPVILLTALTGAEDKVKGFEIGADDYIPKPFTVKGVVLRVRCLLEQRRTVRDLAARLRGLKQESKGQADLQNLLFHELRNKLLVIGGFSNRLVSDAREKPLEKMGQYARVTQANSRYLSSLEEEIVLRTRPTGSSRNSTVECARQCSATAPVWGCTS